MRREVSKTPTRVSCWSIWTSKSPPSFTRNSLSHLLPIRRQLPCWSIVAQLLFSFSWGALTSSRSTTSSRIWSNSSKSPRNAPRLSKNQEKTTSMVCLSAQLSPRKFLSFSASHCKCRGKILCTSGKYRNTSGKFFQPWLNWKCCCKSTPLSNRKWLWWKLCLKFMRPISWKLNRLTSRRFWRRSTHQWSHSTSATTSRLKPTWRGT